MRTILTAAVILAAGCASHTAAPDPTPPALPACTSSLVIVVDGDPFPCNPTPPTRIMILWPGADAYDEPYYRGLCADMGGTFAVVDEPTGSPTAACINPDY